MKRVVIIFLTVFALLAAVARLGILYLAPGGVINSTPTGHAVDAWLFSYRAPLAIHIIGSAVYMSIIPFQLKGGFDARYRRHVLLGRVAGVSVIVSMLFALPLAFLFSLETYPARLMTGLGAALVLTFIVHSLRAIGTGAIEIHRRYMLAAYVLMLGATAERLWLHILFHLQIMSPEALLNVGVPLFSLGPMLMALYVAARFRTRKAVAA